MSRGILDSLRRVSPGAAPAPDGVPRVTPAALDELAGVVALAAAEGWRMRIEGRGTWCPPDAPAHLAVSTAALDRVVAVAPGDLVATAQAGAGMDTLARTLAGHGMRLALDPPGHPDRSLGSVLATATAGPLCHRAGPVRDHVLGLTLVTGTGTVVRAGGTVVKNVAGYDLARLAVGGFGAFGVIAEAHLRLRAHPAASVTLLARGPLGPLLDAALDLTRAGTDLAALELLSPGLTGAPAWTLVARLEGTGDGVAAGVAHVRAAAALPWETAADPAAGGLLRAVARAVLDTPASIRLGVLPDGIPDALDLLARTLDAGRVSASPGRGGLRWSGPLTVPQVAGLRRALAEREIPLTLERAPWPLRHAAGHFGAYREGVAPLTARLRRVFDPASLFAVPLEGDDDR